MHISELWAVRNIGPKKRFGATPRVLYITRQVCRSSRRCYLVTFLDIRSFMICLWCPSDYLQLEKSRTSKIEVEHFYDPFEVPYIWLKTRKLLCQSPYRGSVKISYNLAVFFHFFVLQKNGFKFRLWPTSKNSPLHIFW